MCASRLSSSTGPIQLGALLGKGGEGAVYEVAGTPGVVAKVYHKPLLPDKRAKLEAMPSMVSEKLLALTAWPTDLLRSHGEVFGFLMPKIEGHKDIHTLYGPKSRRIEFPNADWRHLVRAAVNTARAFAFLHESGCVVGDVNHGGVRVSAQSTVKLIDCDSFQIFKDGKYFFCEVGVENFTPPELQGRPFKGIVRTPNHDNFGLAVLIFNLLMMGRHPFAGRYSGRGEMPVEKAIAEFRYAYGRDAGSMQMQAPPHSCQPIIASTDIADLWERAFAQNSTQPGARPTAREWVAKLSEIEKRFRQCSVHPAHYFLQTDKNCPWCKLEQSSAILLFALPATHATHATGPRFDLVVVWAAITKVKAPTTSPPPPLPQLRPSSAAKSLGRLRKSILLLGRVSVVIITIALAVTLNQLWFLWLLLGWGAWAAVEAVAESFAGITPFRDKQRHAHAEYQDLTRRWSAAVTSETFISKLRELEQAKRAWEGLKAERRTLYENLLQQREKNARRRYLESFEIENAKIPGIGPAKRSMLESYNIETAADIERSAILNVPGFGPAMATRLEDWRRSIEVRFVFDRNSAIDPRDVANLETRINAKRAELEKALRAGASELSGIASNVDRQRSLLLQHLERSSHALAQANADLAALES